MSGARAVSASERTVPVLLTRHEAADLCRCSVRHFDRHVAPHLPRVPIGTRVVFDQEDVIAWLRQHEHYEYVPARLVSSEHPFEWRQRPADSAASVVYFIADGDGYVKVGHALDLSKRMCRLQTGNARTLKLIGSINGGPITETWVHRVFRWHRHRGEWFRDSDALREAIARIVGEA
jgi:hypothetical protein